MKKNLISVVILALVLANLILTAILTISVLPQTKKANELITKVCTAIDLDLEGGNAEEAATVPMDKVEAYPVNGGESLTVNLKDSEDGTPHWAVLQVTLSVNTEDKDYKTFGTPELLAAKDGILSGKINEVIGSHTMEEMRSDQQAIQNEVMEALRKQYDSNFIIGVTFTVTFQ